MECKKRGCCKDVHGNGLCATHYRKWWREKHPIKSAYLNLKSNARRRGKEFTITFSDFSKFAIKCRLFLNKGRTMESFTVDRIDNDLGYVLGNLQVLSKEKNIEKYYRDKKLIFDWDSKFATTQNITQEKITDSPF